MDWIRSHPAQTAGIVFLFFGVMFLLFPQSVMPQKKLEQLKKINFPKTMRSEPEKMPLALNIFLRFFGLILLIAGAACWYSGTR